MAPYLSRPAKTGLPGRAYALAGLDTHVDAYKIAGNDPTAVTKVPPLNGFYQLVGHGGHPSFHSNAEFKVGPGDTNYITRIGTNLHGNLIETSVGPDGKLKVIINGKERTDYLKASPEGIPIYGGDGSWIVARIGTDPNGSLVISSSTWQQAIGARTGTGRNGEPIQYLDTTFVSNGATPASRGLIGSAFNPGVNNQLGSGPVPYPINPDDWKLNALLP